MAGSGGRTSGQSDPRRRLGAHGVILAIWSILQSDDGSEWIMAIQFSWKYPRPRLGIRCFFSFVLLAMSVSEAWAALPDQFHVAVGYSGLSGDASAAQLVCGRHQLSAASIRIDVNGVQLTYSVTCIASSGLPNIAIGSPTNSQKESLPKLMPDFNNPTIVPINQKGFGRATVNVEMSPVASRSDTDDLVFRRILPPLGLLNIRVSPVIDRP